MFNNLLVDYGAREYVYIIKNNEDYYVLDDPLDQNECEEQEFAYVEGYVCDIRRASDVEELTNLKKQRYLLEKYKENLNVFKRQRYTYQTITTNTNSKVRNRK